MKGFSMNKRRIATMMIFSLLVLTLMACESDTPSGLGSPLAYPTLTPLPLPDYNMAAIS
jgi:hypothetical protein